MGDTPIHHNKRDELGMTGNIFWHHMNVPHEERFAYIKELHNSYKLGRDDTGKHKVLNSNPRYGNFKDKF